MSSMLGLRDITLNDVLSDTTLLSSRDGSRVRLPDMDERPILWNLEEDDREVKLPPCTADMDLIHKAVLGTIEILEKFKIVPPTTTKPHHVVGVEVGDDRLDASRNPIPLAMSIDGQSRVFRMRTSKEDTFLSTWVWNLCEHTDVIPDSPDQCWNRTRKSGSAKHLGYTDYPPLRVVIDAGGANQEHLRSIPGKVGLLSNQSTLTHPACTFVMEVAHYLQDGLLTTYRGSDPKYLPKSLGGCGAPPLFHQWENIYLAMLGYRGGGYSRVYGSVVQEAQSTLHSMERGAMSVSTPLMKRIRMRQEYLHGTYANEIFIPRLPLYVDSKRGVTAEPLYEMKAVHSHLYGPEERIVRTRLLIRRTEAEIEIEKTKRLLFQLFGYYKVPEVLSRYKAIRMEARRKFDFALSANSAFQRLLDRKAGPADPRELRKHGFDVSVAGVQVFSPEQARWIALGCTSEVYTLEDIPQVEDIFVREDVSTEESMKVGSIPLLPLQTGSKGRFQVTTTKVGLYEIGPGMLEWAQDRVDTLKSIRRERKITADDLAQVYSHNPEWVRDDTLLIGESIRKSVLTPLGKPIFYVGRDFRLARRIANTTVRTVYVIRPAALFTKLRRQDISAKMVINVAEIDGVVAKDQYYVEPGFVLQDSGSILADTMNIVEEGKEGKFYKRHLIAHRSYPDGKRTATYRCEPVDARVRYQAVHPVSSGNVRRSRNLRDTLHLSLNTNWRVRSISTST